MASELGITLRALIRSAGIYGLALEDLERDYRDAEGRELASDLMEWGVDTSAPDYLAKFVTEDDACTSLLLLMPRKMAFQHQNPGLPWPPRARNRPGEPQPPPPDPHALVLVLKQRPEGESEASRLLDSQIRGQRFTRPGRPGGIIPGLHGDKDRRGTVLPLLQASARQPQRRPTPPLQASASTSDLQRRVEPPRPHSSNDLPLYGGALSQSQPTPTTTDPPVQFSVATPSPQLPPPPPPEPPNEDEDFSSFDPRAHMRRPHSDGLLIDTSHFPGQASREREFAPRVAIGRGVPYGRSSALGAPHTHYTGSFGRNAPESPSPTASLPSLSPPQRQSPPVGPAVHPAFPVAAAPTFPIQPAGLSVESWELMWAIIVEQAESEAFLGIRDATLMALFETRHPGRRIFSDLGPGNLNHLRLRLLGLGRFIRTRFDRAGSLWLRPRPRDEPSLEPEPAPEELFLELEAQMENVQVLERRLVIHSFPPGNPTNDWPALDIDVRRKLWQLAVEDFGDGMDSGQAEVAYRLKWGGPGLELARRGLDAVRLFQERLGDLFSFRAKSELHGFVRARLDIAVSLDEAGLEELGLLQEFRAAQSRSQSRCLLPL